MFKKIILGIVGFFLIGGIIMAIVKNDEYSTIDLIESSVETVMEKKDDESLAKLKSDIDLLSAEQKSLELTVWTNSYSDELNYQTPNELLLYLSDIVSEENKNRLISQLTKAKNENDLDLARSIFIKDPTLKTKDGSTIVDVMYQIEVNLQKEKAEKEKAEKEAELARIAEKKRIAEENLSSKIKSANYIKKVVDNAEIYFSDEYCTLHYKFVPSYTPNTRDYVLYFDKLGWGAYVKESSSYSFYPKAKYKENGIWDNRKNTYIREARWIIYYTNEYQIKQLQDEYDNLRNLCKSENDLDLVEQRLEKERIAQENGFNTYDEYQSHLAREVQAKRLAREKAKRAQRCKSDWRSCSDNKELINNYNDITSAKVDCQFAAEKRAKYEVDWAWSKFGKFYTGDNYVKTGIVTLIDNRVKFQNGFGAMVKTTVKCRYDLDRKEVITINID